MALVALRNTGLNDVARCFAVGVVGMMAVFIRVTSAAFIAPWAWFTVVRAGRGSLARAAKGAASGMAAALTACACVAVDTMYFSRARGGDVDVTLPTHWVITPLNWFRYNIDTDNLSRTAYIRDIYTRSLTVQSCSRTCGSSVFGEDYEGNCVSRTQRTEQRSPFTRSGRASCYRSSYFLSRLIKNPDF